MVIATAIEISKEEEENERLIESELGVSKREAKKFKKGVFALYFKNIFEKKIIIFYFKLIFFYIFISF